MSLLEIPVLRSRIWAPRPLFRTWPVVIPGYDQLDVGPNGRFSADPVPADPLKGTVIDVVLNWQSVLKR
jgi:hypothetical protein